MAPAWDRIARILDAALDCPAAERAAFLDRECQGDEALRHEVETLLAHEGGGSRLIHAAVSSAAESAQGLATGERLGGYEVVRELGRGGMGAVYLAVRADDVYRRQVALKVVKRGMDSEFIVARFRQERQILAALEHPAIARLYDGGTTEDGRPFLVMEYVEGLALNDFCEQTNPLLTERLRLFLDICGAVEAAHRSLIVHRDLKPSNILVTAEGQVKLLDFGIAKLLDHDQAETAALTHTTMRLLTPEYASPEQVRGETITTSTDIYALGLVLFEVLTGTRAQPVRDLAPGQWEQWVLETEPEKPSSIAGPLARALKGDLDNITGKALRKEPERRYRTVQEFRDDIERYLSDRPVSARPDTLSYRAAKFIRRHRIPVAAATVAALGLIAGAAIALQQARVARDNAARAERRFAQVRTLARTILFDLDGRIQNLPGATPAREVLVKTSLEYLDSLSRESAGDASLQAELAEAYLRVSSIQGGQYKSNLGRTPEARQSLDKALALQRSVSAQQPGDVRHSLALARTLTAVSDMDEKQGRSNLQAVEEAVAITEAAARRFPSNAAVLVALSEAHSSAYARYLVTREPSKLLIAAARSLEAVEQAERLEPGKHLNGLFSPLNRAARATLRQGQPEKAGEMFARALAILERILAADPHNAKLSRERAFVRLQWSRAVASDFNPNGPDYRAAAKLIGEALQVVYDRETKDTGNVLRYFDIAAIEVEAVILQSEIDPRRSLVHAARARQAIATYLQQEPNHAYGKTVPIEIDIELSRAMLRLANWTEANRLLTNALTARANRPPLRNVDLLARRARARIRGGLSAGAAADARIAAEALQSASIEDTETRDLFAYAECWAVIIEVESRLGRPAQAALASARRKSMFAEIRKRGFSSPHIDRLEAQL